MRLRILEIIYDCSRKILAIKAGEGNAIGGWSLPGQSMTGCAVQIFYKRLAGRSKLFA